MARGWESKSIEDQQAAAEAEAGEKARPALSADERERADRRTALKMSRARAVQDLQTTCDRRHRALLEATIAHLDAELAAIDR